MIDTILMWMKKRIEDETFSSSKFQRRRCGGGDDENEKRCGNSTDSSGDGTLPSTSLRLIDSFDSSFIRLVCPGRGGVLKKTKYFVVRRSRSTGKDFGTTVCLARVEKKDRVRIHSQQTYSRYFSFCHPSLRTNFLLLTYSGFALQR